MTDTAAVADGDVVAGDAEDELLARSLTAAEDFKDDDKNTKARARKGVKTDVPSSEQKKVSTNQNTKQPY